MSGTFARSVCILALAAGTALAPSTPSATADPSGQSGQSVEELLTQLRTLYRQAEEATEAYDATHAELRRQQSRLDVLDGRLATARTQLAAGHRGAGRIARAQYRDGVGLAAYLRVLLSPDPERAVDDSHEIRRAAGIRAAAVGRLRAGEQRLDTLETAARKAVDTRESLVDRQQRERDEVVRRLSDVERLLASLSDEQIAAVHQREELGAEEAQRAFAESTPLDDSRPPSRAGDRAVEYALAQVGKPYAWGAEGPASFDCSGLTYQAWRHAGLTIPRTSGQQWRTLPRVPMDELRPGDLVVYYQKASHVGLYVGDGKVVHAPHPGAGVRVSPVAQNPVLGAVRPDGKEKPEPDPTPAPLDPPAAVEA